MAVPAQARRTYLTFGGAVASGLLIDQGGFRLTSEVIPILFLLALAGLVFGYATARRPWLWALGIGIGARLLPEPALSPEHVAKEGASHPLPLPFGLTASHFAQWLVLSLVIT